MRGQIDLGNGLEIGLPQSEITTGADWGNWGKNGACPSAIVNPLRGYTMGTDWGSPAPLRGLGQKA